MILLIDNYDSFSYNLVQAAGSLKNDIMVIRNDEMTAAEVRKLNPSHIIISPGPGYPKDAGISEDVIRLMKGEVPILGVCLGHQAICEVFGAGIVHAKQLMHGKQSDVRVESASDLFAGLPPVIKAARYHSLVAEPETIPDELMVIARDVENGEVMAVRHRDYPIYGLQFHPESILTPEGITILSNFLNGCPAAYSKKEEIA